MFKALKSVLEAHPQVIEYQTSKVNSGTPKSPRFERIKVHSRDVVGGAKEKGYFVPDVYLHELDSILRRELVSVFQKVEPKGIIPEVTIEEIKNKYFTYNDTKYALYLSDFKSRLTQVVGMLTELKNLGYCNDSLLLKLKEML